MELKVELKDSVWKKVTAIQKCAEWVQKKEGCQKL